uniref:Uncharacterized protein n=1 Tax=Nelumbo nucifera TaxID=4432 RepID=A0A822XZK9_NELNU|nr:TPA_asm: hypothetical protein HUJ06_028552 [Nelumbo nucifera]
MLKINLSKILMVKGSRFLLYLQFCGRFDPPVTGVAISLLQAHCHFLINCHR